MCRTPCLHFTYSVLLFLGFQSNPSLQSNQDQAPPRFLSVVKSTKVTSLIAPAGFLEAPSLSQVLIPGRFLCRPNPKALEILSATIVVGSFCRPAGFSLLLTACIPYILFSCLVKTFLFFSLTLQLISFFSLLFQL